MSARYRRGEQTSFGTLVNLVWVKRVGWGTCLDRGAVRVSAARGGRRRCASPNRLEPAGAAHRGRPCRAAERANRAAGRGHRGRANDSSAAKPPAVTIYGVRSPTTTPSGANTLVA